MKGPNHQVFCLYQFSYKRGLVGGEPPTTIQKKVYSQSAIYSKLLC